MPQVYEQGPFSINELVRRLNNDMYHGNGKPGITTRVQQLEDDVDDIKADVKDFKDTQRWIVRLILATFVIAVLNLILHH